MLKAISNDMYGLLKGFWYFIFDMHYPYCTPVFKADISPHQLGQGRARRAARHQHQSDEGFSDGRGGKRRLGQVLPRRCLPRRARETQGSRQHRRQNCICKQISLVLVWLNRITGKIILI